MNHTATAAPPPRANGRRLDAAEIKRQASGRWREIIPAVCGIPAEVLNGKNHPCPSCGGNDRFAAFGDFAETGGVNCRGCHDKNNGDGLATVMRFRGVDLPAACRLVDDFLGGNLIAFSRPTALAAGDADKNRSPSKNPATATQEKREKQSPTWPSLESLISSFAPGPTAIYRYQHRGGEDAGAQIRLPDPDRGKTFRSVRRNANGGWSWGAMPDPRPMYHLPELVSSTSAVLVVEGEKDVEAAETLGLTATTWPCGADSCGKVDLSPLAGRDVVLLPDNDTAGREAMDTIADRLAELSPRPTVRRLDITMLPSGDPMPEKGDLSDWVDAHGDSAETETLRENLESLLADAEAVELSEADSPLTWQPFPAGVLPPVARALVEEAAAAIPCDPAMIALPALAAAAGAIGATRTVQLKRGWCEPAILWCVLVSPSGATKSQGRKAVIAPLLRRQKQELALYEEQLREFDQLKTIHDKEHAAWKRDKKDSGPPPDPPEKPELCEVLISDATIEAVGRVLHANPRGVLLDRDELAAWFGSFDAYRSGGKGGDSQNWMNLHGAGHLKINRSSREGAPLFVERACVSVSGTIQPGILNRTLGDEHRESGLAARLLIASPPRRPKRWSEQEVSQATERAFGGRMLELLDLGFGCDEDGGPTPVVLPLASDAKKRFAQFVNEHGKDALDRDGDEAAAWSKLEGYAARLALVLTLLENPEATTVTLPTLESAIVLTKWFANEAARFYRGGRETPEQAAKRQLVEWIEARGGVTTPWELAKGPRQYRKSGEAERALNCLASEGIGHWEVIPSATKQSRKFVLHHLAAAGDSPEHLVSRVNPAAASAAATENAIPDDDPESWEAL